MTGQMKDILTTGLGMLILEGALEAGDGLGMRPQGALGVRR